MLRWTICREPTLQNGKIRVSLSRHPESMAIFGRNQLRRTCAWASSSKVASSTNRRTTGCTRALTPSMSMSCTFGSQEHAREIQGRWKHCRFPPTAAWRRLGQPNYQDEGCSGHVQIPRQNSRIAAGGALGSNSRTLRSVQVPSFALPATVLIPAGRRRGMHIVAMPCRPVIQAESLPDTA